MQIKSNVVLTAIMFLLIIWYAYSMYIVPSYYTAVNSGTVMTPNWWKALNWIRANTTNCSVVATYWDPGHMITAVAQRPVVFDGATQGSRRTIDVKGNINESEIKKIAGLSNYVVKKNKTDTLITTARIQDISTSLMTSNEDTAVRILKKYLMPNCTSMYYIASADLVYKSQWWTYFATWDPTYKGSCRMLKDPHGDCYFYTPLRLSGVKQSGNITAYEYALGPYQKFIIYERNSSYEVMLQQGNNFLRVKRAIIFSNHRLHIINQKNYKVDGTILMQNYEVVYYIPKELENSMFTRLFFFNGLGLKHFKMVGDWGGEVKVFKVEFNQTK